MAVEFFEVWKNSGLDLDATPRPAMILPLGGSNVIRVLHAEGSNPLYDTKGILEIKEMDGGPIVLDKFFAYTVPIFMVASSPGAAAALQLKLAAEVAIKLAHSGRFFRVTGKALGGAVGTMLLVNPEPNLPLRVVVLRPRPLKLSIRPVQVRNNKGSFVYHCESNYDTKVLLDRVNAIWTPQANIVFALASSNPALIDDEVRISEALGGWGRTLPKIVEYDAFKDMFKDVKVNENPKADFTIFMVNGLTDGGVAVRGTTNTDYGFALVSDSGRVEDSRTMAHEIGHYFGTLGKKGVQYGDFQGKNQEDLLMGAGGDGTKVPFADVIKYFNTNYK
jgi:hypothetical protein